jgi:hypothetical protein
MVVNRSPTAMGLSPTIMQPGEVFDLEFSRDSDAPLPASLMLRVDGVMTPEPVPLLYRDRWRALYGPVDEAQLRSADDGFTEPSLTVLTEGSDPGAELLVAALEAENGMAVLPRRLISNISDGPRDPESYGPRGDELFESLGERYRTLELVSADGEVVAQGHQSTRGEASWLYYSGAYQDGVGAEFLGDDIAPTRFAVRGKAWRGRLEVLILAADHALKIGGRGPDDPIGSGWHGAGWWVRFEGTALGYRGEAPIGEESAKVMRAFLGELAPRHAPLFGVPRSRIEDEDLALHWIRANESVGVFTASAIAPDGRYYYSSAPGVAPPPPGLRVSETIDRTIEVVERYHWEGTARAIYLEEYRTSVP